jgi:CubicO group peptidase (beta-lactamase class C family)
MPRPHPLPCAALSLALLLSPAAVAQNLPCHDFQAIPPIAAELLAAWPLTGSSVLRIDQHGQTVFARAFGSYTLATVVPIASATKTLSAAVLMSLVDSGALALDDRVGQWLPEWNTGVRAQITLRMCFSHTSGLPASHPAMLDETITLRQAAARLATAALEYPPGTTFRYGDVGMHVAGAVCEVASGQSWANLFAQRIAQPLQMVATDYLGLGSASNPRIGHGGRSNQRDYAVFFDLLRAGGTWNGTRVLSVASVETMLTDHTSGLPIGHTPHPYRAPYGIGIWLDRSDSQGRVVFASGVGALGFAGWLDRDHDASGAFVIRNQNPQTYPYLERMWQAAADAMLPPGITCFGAGSPTCAGGTWANGSSPAAAGNLDFEVRSAHAPTNAPGFVLLGDPLVAGQPFVDLVGHVGPTIAVAAAVASDADGRAALAAPLPTALAGATLGLQSLWLTPATCTQLGLQASHALRLDVAP